MKTTVKYIVSLFAVFLFSLNSSANYPPVFIDAGGQVGRGFAVSRGADCYVIVPKHVIANPVSFKVHGKPGRTSRAEREPTRSNWDVGLLKINTPSAVCEYDYFLPDSDLSKYLKVKSSAILRIPQSDGKYAQMEVKLSRWDQDHITISTLGTNTNLQQGLSGSMLYASGALVGMLTTVDTTTGKTGKVLRIERIHRSIGDVLPLFRPIDEQGRYDNQIAGEILQKNLNYLNSRQFCQNLIKMSRWLVKRDWKPTYTSKRFGSQGEIYSIPSIVISGTDSELSFSGKQATIRTKVGRVPPTQNPQIIKRQIVASISRCINHDTLDDPDDLRFRDGPTDRGAVSWSYEYTSDWGRSLEGIMIVLHSSSNFEFSMFADMYE